jgi:hypothetical protein
MVGAGGGNHLKQERQMTELRKGDKVSVTGTIKYPPDKDERVFIKIDGSHEDLWVRKSLVTLVQAQFEVGDRVGWEYHTTSFAGEIIATSGEHAWIEYNNGEYCTRTFSSIEHLPDEPEAAPDEEAPQPVDDGSCDPLYGERMDSADMGEEPRTAAGSLD